MSIKAKKSLGSRLATIITTTVLLFTSIPLIPQSLKDNTFNSITASADGTGYIADGGGGNNGTSSSDPRVAAFPSYYGLKFYLINRNGDIVRWYYYNIKYGNITDTATLFEGSKAMADKYATDYAKYYLLKADKKAYLELNQKLINFFTPSNYAPDEADNYVSGSYKQIYLWDDIKNVVNSYNCVVTPTNGGTPQTYNFKKSELLTKMEAKMKTTDGGKKYIEASSAVSKLTGNALGKWGKDSYGYGRRDLTDPTVTEYNSNLHLESGLFVANSLTNASASYYSAGPGLIIDILADANDYYKDGNTIATKHEWDLRFPLGTKSSTSGYSEKAMRTINSHNTPLGNIYSLMPDSSHGRGAQLAKWMTTDISDATLPIQKNQVKVYRDLFYNDSYGDGSGYLGKALMEQTMFLFNQESKQGTKQGETDLTDLQKAYSTFDVVVEPIVSIPLRPRYDANKSDTLGRYNGSWTGYMRALDEAYGSEPYSGGASQSCGGSTNQWIKKANQAYGYFCSQDMIQRESVSYGRYALDLILNAEVGITSPSSPASGPKAFTKQMGYEMLYRGDTTVPADYENSPYGLQIYYVSGMGHDYEPEPEGEDDVINTYAVDLVPNPNVPERPEYSHDSDGNKATSDVPSDAPNIGTNTGRKTSGDDTFEIVKIYADLYRNTDMVNYVSSAESVKQAKENSEILYYVDPRDGSPTSGDYVAVDRANNYIYNANKPYTLDADGYVVSGTTIKTSDKKSVPAVLAKEPLAIPTEDDAIVKDRRYTGISQVKYTYMTNTSRNVFITEELDKTSIPGEDLNGYRVLTWHASEYSERELVSGGASPYSVYDWVTLDTVNASSADGNGGYKLDINFQRQKHSKGDTSEVQYRYDPSEITHKYSKLYEEHPGQDGAAPLGLYANDDSSSAMYGSLTIDTNELTSDKLRTLYVLYVRELPYIQTDGTLDNGNGTGTGNGERTTDTNDHGKGTGTENQLPQHKFNIVKIYGVINPYSYAVTPTAIYAQSQNTYNVRITDEYGTQATLPDGTTENSEYHLRAYSLVSSTPNDKNVYGSGFSTKNGNFYIDTSIQDLVNTSYIDGRYTYSFNDLKTFKFAANHWADGCKQWDEAAYENDTTISEYAMKGFIDGYDGLGWTHTNKSFGASNPDLKPIEIKSSIPPLTKGSTSNLNEDIFGKNNLSSMAASYGAAKSNSVYTYPYEGYDRTIYFGDAVKKSGTTDGTLYLLYIKGDVLNYNGSIVIPESYITKRFDLNKVEVELSGAVQGSDTTSQKNQPIATHRFKVTAKNVVLPSSDFQFFTPNSKFTDAMLNQEYSAVNEFGTTSTNGARALKLPASENRYAININVIGINTALLNCPSDLKLVKGLKQDVSDSSISGIFNSMSSLGRIVPPKYNYKYDTDPSGNNDAISEAIAVGGNKLLYRVKHGFFVSSVKLNDYFKHKNGTNYNGAAGWTDGSIYQFNGLTYTVVLGRFDDPVQLAGWKYNISEEKCRAIFYLNDYKDDTIRKFKITLRQLFDNNIKDLNTNKVDYPETALSKFTSDSTLNRAIVADIIMIKNSKNNKIISALVTAREVSPDSDYSELILTDTTSTSITSDNYTSSSSLVDVDITNDTDVACAILKSYYIRTKGTATVPFEKVGTFANSKGLLNYTNLYSTGNYMTSPISTVGQAPTLLDSVIPRDTSFLLFGRGQNLPVSVSSDGNAGYLRYSYGTQASEVNDAKNITKINNTKVSNITTNSGTKYNGHNVTVANNKKFRFIIAPVAILNGDVVLDYEGKRDNAGFISRLERLYYYYEIVHHPAEYEEVDGVQQLKKAAYDTYIPKQKSANLIFDTSDALDISLTAYYYTYSGLSMTPYYIANTGIPFQYTDGTTGVAKADIDYSFTSPSVTVNGKKVNNTQLPTYTFASIMEDNKTKVANVDAYASVTKEPKVEMIDSSGKCIASIRKSAVADGASVKFYPYYLMQYETDKYYNPTSYKDMQEIMTNNKHIPGVTATEDGKTVKTVLNKALPVLIAGSYSRQFVPDEYHGIKIHDKDVATINFDTPICVVNNFTDSKGNKVDTSKAMPGKITIRSEQWSTHATANANMGDLGCVLPGGAMFGISISEGNRRYIDIETYAPILTGDGRNQVLSTELGFFNSASGISLDQLVTGGLPDKWDSSSEAAKLHEELKSTFEKYINTLDIDMYVDYSSTGSVLTTTQGDKNITAEQYKNKNPFISNKLDSEDIFNVQAKDPKYYLTPSGYLSGNSVVTKKGSVIGAADASADKKAGNQADLDIGMLDTVEKDTYFTFFTTVDGRILVNVSDDLATSAKTTTDTYDTTYGHRTSSNVGTITSDDNMMAGTYQVLDRGQSISNLQGAWKEFNDKTGIVTKLCEALERNHGYDPSCLYRKNGANGEVGFSGWYNEAFDGITYVKHVTHYAVGFKDTYERNAVLDPTLTPTQTSKEDMFTKYNAAQFRSSDICLEAARDFTGGKANATVNGKTATISVLGYVTINGTKYPLGITPDKMQKLFVSDIFFIPNATVQDLK